MIPYIEWNSFQIGPLTIYVWGLFVASGFIAAAYTAGWMAKRRGLKPKVIYDLTVWMMLAGIVGGRLGHVLFYDLETFLNDPASIFWIWEGGLSIYGGFFLSVAVGLWYLKKRQVDVFAYSDVVLFGMPVGLWIGRIGCFLIHDHPGTATDFALGVEYPDGVVRHDHGLYLSINGLLMAIVFFILARKERPTGFYIGLFSIWYGVVRFTLDYWRIGDVRYAGLTPAQYFSIALAVFGMWLLYRIKKQIK